MHSYINYGAVIELALNRGVSHLYKRKMIVNDPGDAREFKSMDDVLKALDIVFNDIMDVDEGLVMTQEQVEKEFYPCSWQSAFMEDCVERGLPKERGGARYNFGGPAPAWDSPMPETPSPPSRGHFHRQEVYDAPTVRRP